MNSIIIIIGLMAWIWLSVVVASYAARKGEPFILTFVSSLFLSPFLIFIFIYVARDRKNKECISCGEKISMKAKVCPHCFASQKAKKA